MINNILLIGSSTIKKWSNFTLNLDNEVVFNKGVSGLFTKDIITTKYIKFITRDLKNYPKYINH
jgi:hypothetical protein